MAKKKNETKPEPILNLKGELLKLSMEYRKDKDIIEKLEEKLNKKKEIIIKKANQLKVLKAKSQLLSFSCKRIKKVNVSTKKLKEELIARKLDKIYKSCEYEIEYDMLSIKWRKGGSNIF